MASSYWIFLITGGVCTIPVMQSLGVITGRVGVIALCQMSFAMVGAWTVGWCNVHGVPGGFLAWTVVGGLAAIPCGLLIGLPALRLRGARLAIATFAFATGMDVVFGNIQFPGTDQFLLVTRPAMFESDGAFLQLSVLVVAVLFVLLALIDRTRLGASWLELRYSERGAAAHGTNVAVSKLAAFGIAAFFSAIGGALMAGQSGSLTTTSFGSQVSLTYFAIAVVIGTRQWSAALMAGLAGPLMPSLIDKLHISQSYVTVLFGFLAVFTIAAGKGQMGQSEIMIARKQAKIARLESEQGRRVAVAATPAGAAAGGAATAGGAVGGSASGTADDDADTTGATGVTGADGASATGTADRTRTAGATVQERRPAAARPDGTEPTLQVRDLSVRFGAVTAVDSVSFTLQPGAVTALLGPNGAGKSTLINAATGFASCTGQVLLNGRELTGSPHRRARAGLRRSFQQLRVPPTLTVGSFLTTAAGRKLSAAEIDDHLAWFGCPPAHVPIGTMDIASRRLLEVAGLAAGEPGVLLLDEPAAGQGARERELLGARIAEIPARTGSTVLLVEHDMDLVRAVCGSLIVMDFGRVIASGDPQAVLSDPAVVTAYVGAEAAVE
ncbi:ATP-binding cassette domain-containing protein [Catenulispora yoronensis]